MKYLGCFKSYDIRGVVPEEFSEELAYKIAIAYTAIISPKRVVVGCDVRLESKGMKQSITRGFNDSGVEVVDIGLCGSEEIYHYCFSNISKIDGGIMVTASHNPKGHNGMKLVGKGGRPMSMEDDLKKIHDYVINYKPLKKSRKEVIDLAYDKTQYIDHLLNYVDIKTLRPLKILVNPGNGPAGSIVKLLEEKLPFNFIYINEVPDGNFPKGVPNPMLPENRQETSNAVKECKADLGIAWDGDFDRCFFFDENGDFIDGYYIVGLIAQSILERSPQEKIVHDPRLLWNTVDIINEYNGLAVQSKSGHSFIKKTMRKENAVYGGEMSAHHYFRDFGYCDSGMIPWLIISELISKSKGSLSSLINERIKKFPCSGEINYRTNRFDLIVKRILEKYKNVWHEVDKTDGISLNFKDWRFNLRKSNTENLIRLNIETFQNTKKLNSCIDELELIIYHTNSIK